MEEPLLFDQTIRKIEFLFRYAGINIRSGEQNPSNRFKCRLIFLFNFLWLNFDLCGAIYWFIDGVKRGKDFLELTYTGPCLSISTLANFKSIFLVINEKHVHKLIENLRRLERQVKKRAQSFEKQKMVQQEKKFLDIVLNTLIILFVTMIITFTLSPLVIIAVKYYQTRELELLLPILTLYPFDPFQIKVWPFMYLHQFWSECVDTMYICCADCLFFVNCTYIRIQFKLLRDDLQNIITINGSSNKKFVENEDFRNNLENLIKWHQDLIESANILEIIYSKSTLLNFVSSSLIICLTGFNVMIMANGDLSFIMIFLSFLFMSLVQVFFMCYFADLLMSSSTDISEAVYNSQWYMADAKIGKILLIVLTRSQKPCKITASGFADVNLNSFLRVLSTSYSYFALLQTMYGN